VIHAGGENGVVESALLIWRLSQLDEFRRLWKMAAERISYQCTPHSIFVVDNSPYHSFLLECTPSANSRKVDVKTSFLPMAYHILMICLHCGCID
jgi:hypothetical protein